MVNAANGNETPLTSGRFVVQDILKWDAETNIIFYTANTPEDSQVQHIHAVKAVAGQFSQCLTCGIMYNGVNQTYFTAEFSKTGKSLVLVVEGPSIPRADIYTWSVDSKDGNIFFDCLSHIDCNILIFIFIFFAEVVLKHVQPFETNEELHERLSAKATPKIIYLNIPLSSGFDARVKLQLPPNADLSGTVKYPMLVDVYAGPDSYNGADRFDLGWGSYLASNKSVIFAQINGRGSGLRGDRLMHEIYRKFGTVEILDQIETAK